MKHIPVYHLFFFGHCLFETKHNFCYFGEFTNLEVVKVSRCLLKQEFIHPGEICNVASCKLHETLHFWTFFAFCICIVAFHPLDSQQLKFKHDKFRCNLCSQFSNTPGKLSSLGLYWTMSCCLEIAQACPR